MSSDDRYVDVWELPFELRDRVGHAAGDRDRVGTRVLVDDKSDCLCAVESGEREWIGESECDCADITQCDARTGPSEWCGEDF